MPNYTKNTLVVKGEEGLLRFFYDYNRVSEDEERYLSDIHGKKKDLSFSKAVNIESGEFMLKYILSKNKSIKGVNDLYYDSANIMWGTKWNAGDPVVDLQSINEGKIKYTFDTAWCYPYEWLEQVSKLFPALDFEIIFTNEDDNYDDVFEYTYKDGKHGECKMHRSQMRIIEEKDIK